MPTYRNDSDKRLVVSGQTLEPGQTIATNVYYSIEGLTKISEEPFYDPVIASERLTITASNDVDIAIPSGVESFSIDIFVKSGDVDLTINNSENQLMLTAGMRYSEKCLSRIIDVINVLAESDAEVIYNILRI